jgi:endogenous inhibitor of DNA gyrase (YacG/DUF329 family)
MATIVKCPVCGKPVAWIEANRWRPFCSERCKTIDLGDWAANRHVIAGSSADTTDESPTPAAPDPPR